MELGDQEWCDTLLLRYGIYPPDIPPHCGGSNTKFSIFHVLYCKKSVLIMTCHNKICDGFADLEGKALTPSYVCYDALIHPGHSLLEGKAHPVGSPHRNSPVATENSEQK